jgi:hypothetical protein
MAHERVPQEQSIMQRVASMKWSPMQSLSNAEYEAILREKLLRIDADIAIVDEDIEKLKKEASCNKEESSPTKP